MKSPADPHSSDERVVYVACLLALFMLLQAMAFAGHSRVIVLACAAVYFAGTVLVQSGPAHVRLVNAAAFTAMLTLLGYGIGLAA